VDKGFEGDQLKGRTAKFGIWVYNANSNAINLHGQVNTEEEKNTGGNGLNICVGLRAGKKRSGRRPNQGAAGQRLPGTHIENTENNQRVKGVWGAENAKRRKL